jgi:hypothetical protein
MRAGARLYADQAGQQPPEEFERLGAAELPAQYDLTGCVY